MITFLRRIRFGIAAGAGIVSALTALWSGYLALMTFAAWRARRAGRDTTPMQALATTPIRVLVPAHNEEQLIAETMKHLAAVDYPGHLFDVHVVADNCTDETADIVREHGFHAHERHDLDSPGKGPALGWLLDELPVDDRPEASIVLIDADTIVDAGILRVFDGRLVNGDDVIQGYYAVRDADAGGNVGFRAAALAVRHYVRPLGRTELGGSSGLFGNGMAFRESVARTHIWSDHLVEDIEMGLSILLEGGAVAYAADAVVEAEMPVILEDADSQNQRWEAGRAQIMASFGPRLIQAARHKRHGRRWPYVDALLDLTLPPITLLVAATGASAGVVRLFARGRSAKLGLAVGVVSLVVQMGHVLSALRMVGAPPAVYRALLSVPGQIAWKVRLVVRMIIRRGPDRWVRTTRNEDPA